MEKIILVDGNNLLFRSYYATAYNGNFMNNSKGFPTNALFGFTNMINKIILEEKPNHILVAFDKGKTFRHDAYPDYKGGRGETPDELKKQFPIAKDLLSAMGIKWYDIDNYEADDIIGTFASFCDKNESYEAVIISSDKDLLQLISSKVEMKQLKMKDYIRYNEETFNTEYGFEPIKIIDLKSLMGDPSDNIPGVKGIGEKTALKLIQDYRSLDGVYENLDNLTPKLKEKLLIDKDAAYESYFLATINKNVPIDITIDDIKYNKKDNKKLTELYENLEFYSFLKKVKQEDEFYNLEEENDLFVDDIVTELKYEIVDSYINIEEDSSIYLEILGTNYHNSKILGLSIYNKNKCYYIPFEILKMYPNILNENIKYTYDYKKLKVALKWNNINIDTIEFDSMTAGYLLDYNIKEDIAYLANQLDYKMDFYDDVYRKLKTKNIYDECEVETTIKLACLKAKFIYETKDLLIKKLEDQNLIDLYKEIEFPLAPVLGDMEYNGINVETDTLNQMGIKINDRMFTLEEEIYELADQKFNISSPKQLGEIIFDKLNLSHGKKIKTGFSTNIDTLEKLKDDHPIIDKIITYRTLSKLYSTYVEGLKNVIMFDNKIHTIYNQTLTRTGRLSSIEPNLQNIPIRFEEGRLIRKAFVPSRNSVILSADYSQIELRILAAIANIPSLIEAFKQGIDIHTKTASDILKIDLKDVTKEQRRIAKAVNFGIIYGISKYGLSENVGISNYEAGQFIDNYFIAYPGIKEYMEQVIKDAYKNGYVTTLMNRKRIIPELFNKNKMIKSSGERMALNTPIQGTSADIIKKAMIDIDQEFKKLNLKSKMILQVHDELIFDCLKEELEIVTKVVTDKMENVIKLSVPLNIEISFGNDWYEAK